MGPSVLRIAIFSEFPEAFAREVFVDGLFEQRIIDVWWRFGIDVTEFRPQSWQNRVKELNLARADWQKRSAEFDATLDFAATATNGPSRFIQHPKLWSYIDDYVPINRILHPILSAERVKMMNGGFWGDPVVRFGVNTLQWQPDPAFVGKHLLVAGFSDIPLMVRLAEQLDLELCVIRNEINRTILESYANTFAKISLVDAGNHTAFTQALAYISTAAHLPSGEIPLVAQALACGTPVLAKKAAGALEWIGPAGLEYVTLEELRLAITTALPEREVVRRHALETVDIVKAAQTLLNIMLPPHFVS